MPDINDMQQPRPDARQAIADAVTELMQHFPDRDEVKQIAQDVVPAELLHLDDLPSGSGNLSATGAGGDVLRRGKATTGQLPAAYWGKAVTALKVGSTNLAGIVELAAGEGMTGEVEGNKITFINAGVTKLRGSTGISVSPSTGIGEVTLAINPIARIAPTSGYVLTYVQVIASDESGTTLRFTGKNAAGVESSADIVIGTGGGGSSGFNQSVTVYGKVYDFNGQLLQETWTYTYVNGALQSITAGSPHPIGNLTPCT